MAPLLKPSATKRKLEKKAKRTKLVSLENKHKARVRRRDRFCRFPLCGCRKLGLTLDARQEVSHQRHKGMGGNPSGDRSLPELMLYLCKHRHQDGAVSLHKGTLRARPLTADGTDGPIAWDVDLNVIAPPRHNLEDRLGVAHWWEVAREVKVQQLAPLAPRQRVILEGLAGMEL